METKENALAVHGGASVLPMQRAAKSLIPSNMTELIEYSKMMAKSSIVPKDYQGKPENILVAVQMGLEIGLAPMQALQSVAVINGRPSIWGDAALALVQSSGLLEFIEEYDQGKALQEKTGFCRVKRRGDSMPHEVRFTQDQAQRAGLWGKQGPWTQYAGRMLQMRARAFALRDKFPDVLKGLHVREEIEDIEMERIAESYMPKRVALPVDVAATGYATAVAPVPTSNEVEKTEAPPVEPEPSEDLPPFAEEKVTVDAQVPGEKITVPKQLDLIRLVRHDAKLTDKLQAHIKKYGFHASADITVDKYDEILAWTEKLVGA